MVTYLQNKDQLIYAYIEWGTSFDNKYIYIRDLWIQRKKRVKFGSYGLIKELIPLILANPCTKDSEYVYWNREKYGGRQVKTIPIDYFKGEKNAIHLSIQRS